MNTKHLTKPQLRVLEELQAAGVKTYVLPVLSRYIVAIEERVVVGEPHLVVIGRRGERLEQTYSDYGGARWEKLTTSSGKRQNFTEAKLLRLIADFELRQDTRGGRAYDRAQKVGPRKPRRRGLKGRVGTPMSVERPLHKL